MRGYVAEVQLEEDTSGEGRWASLTPTVVIIGELRGKWDRDIPGPPLLEDGRGGLEQVVRDEDLLGVEACGDTVDVVQRVLGPEDAWNVTRGKPSQSGQTLMLLVRGRGYVPVPGTHARGLVLTIVRKSIR